MLVNINRCYCSRSVTAVAFSQDSQTVFSVAQGMSVPTCNQEIAFSTSYIDTTLKMFSTNGLQQLRSVSFSSLVRPLLSIEHL